MNSSRGDLTGESAKTKSLVQTDVSVECYSRNVGTAGSSHGSSGGSKDEDDVDDSKNDGGCPGSENGSTGGHVNGNDNANTSDKDGDANSNVSAFGHDTVTAVPDAGAAA